MACLDTTFLIDLSRRQGGRRSRARGKLRELVVNEERLVTSRFTVAKLYVGVFRAKNREREEAAVKAVLKDVEILDFSAAAAKIFGRITAFLQEAGRPAGDMDVLIVATALAGGERVIVTRNPVHYEHIAGIQVREY